MKKLLLFAIIIGGSVTFTSCSKDECECTVNGVTTTYDEDDTVGDQSVSEQCTVANAVLTAPDKCEMK